MLHIREALAKEHLLEELPRQLVEFSELKGKKSFCEVGNGLGYTGDLSRGTQELGIRILGHYSDRFGDLLLPHLRGEDVYEQLRFSGF